MNEYMRMADRMYDLDNQIERLEKEKCELLGIIQEKDKVIQELDKENGKLEGKLAKAKDIIQDLLSCLYSVEYDHVSDLEEAEQFLKEEHNEV